MQVHALKSLAMAGALGAATWLAGAGAATAQDVTLKLHQMLPPQAAVPALILEPWAKKVEAESDGRIKIEHYPSMQLGGSPPELVDQVTDGTVDVVWTVPGYTPGRFPGTEVFELPFMMTNSEATSRAYWDFFEKNLQDAEFKDMKVLAIWVHGPGLIHSDTPVESTADLQGLKLRAPSRIVNALLGELGAVPVGMPVPQVPESLSKGVIDGAVIPWEVTKPLRLTELVKNHTEFNGDRALYTATMLLAMNKDAYEALPDDLKAVIDANSGQELAAFAAREQAKADAEGREIAVEAGNNIVELGPDEIAAFEKAAEPVVANWIKEMDDRGLDGQALYDEARSLIDKYTAAQ